MDWSQVVIPTAAETVAPRDVQVSEMVFYKLRVMASVSGRTVTQVYQDALKAYATENWADCETEMTLLSKNLGISPEELFSQLAIGD